MCLRGVILVEGSLTFRWVVEDIQKIQSKDRGVFLAEGSVILRVHLCSNM